MARAIVRYSFNSTGELKYPAEKARADIRAILEEVGFERVGEKGKGTASWELRGTSTATVAGALADVLSVVEHLDDEVLDHVWIYCDE